MVKPVGDWVCERLRAPTRRCRTCAWRAISCHPSAAHCSASLVNCATHSCMGALTQRRSLHSGRLIEHPSRPHSNALAAAALAAGALGVRTGCGALTSWSSRASECMRGMSTHTRWMGDRLWMPSSCAAKGLPLSPGAVHTHAGHQPAPGASRRLPAIGHLSSSPAAPCSRQGPWGLRHTCALCRGTRCAQAGRRR